MGTTVISATFSGVSGNTTLTVTAPTLVSIALTPATPTIGKGTTQQFTATGTYTDATTQNVTTTATWASATPATATISNAGGSQGLATSAAVGTTVISGTSSGVSGHTTLKVSTVMTYGPTHSFNGQNSDFFLSTGQGCCSVGCAGDASVDAQYFCDHFYGTPLNKTCTAKTWTQVNASSSSGWMMHKNSGCTSSGSDITVPYAAACEGGPCKMWNTGAQAYGGLKNLTCDCL